MNMEHNYLRVGVQKLSINGLVEALGEAPIGDPLPRLGRVEFGKMVRIRVGPVEKVIPIDKIGNGVNLGNRVFVHWMGTKRYYLGW